MRSRSKSPIRYDEKDQRKRSLSPNWHNNYPLSSSRWSKSKSLFNKLFFSNSSGFVKGSGAYSRLARETKDYLEYLFFPYDNEDYPSKLYNSDLDRIKEDLEKKTFNWKPFIKWNFSSYEQNVLLKSLGQLYLFLDWLVRQLKFSYFHSLQNMDKLCLYYIACTTGSESKTSNISFILYICNLSFYQQDLVYAEKKMASFKNEHRNWYDSSLKDYPDLPELIVPPGVNYSSTPWIVKDYSQIDFSQFNDSQRMRFLQRKLHVCFDLPSKSDAQIPLRKMLLHYYLCPQGFSDQEILEFIDNPSLFYDNLDPPHITCPIISEEESLFTHLNLTADSTLSEILSKIFGEAWFHYRFVETGELDQSCFNFRRLTVIPVLKIPFDIPDKSIEIFYNLKKEGLESLLKRTPNFGTDFWLSKDDGKYNIIIHFGLFRKMYPHSSTKDPEQISSFKNSVEEFINKPKSLQLTFGSSHLFVDSKHKLIWCDQSPSIVIERSDIYRKYKVN